MLLAIIVILLIIVIGYLGFSLYVANTMTTPFQTRVDINPVLISKDVEEISLTTEDNITLHGWLFKGDSNKLIIIASGLLENRTNLGYYGGFLTKELIEQGYNVLVFDTRNFSTSTNTRVAYGTKEGLDILATIDFAKQKGFEEKNIGIIGYSTGAIATLMVADRLKNIGALVIDSAAAEYLPVVAGVLSREKNVPSIFHPAIFFFNKALFRVDIATVKPIEKIPLAPERVFLFLHAANDKTIPVGDSQKLHSLANKESRLVIFPNGEHIETYKSDPDLYRKEVFGFLEEELGK